MGKFSSGNRKDPTDIYAILAEREAGTKKKPGSAQPRPQPVREMPAQPRPMAQPQPVREMPVQPRPVAQPQPEPAPRAKRSWKGTLIFYLCCLIFVFVFYVGAFIGLNFLKDWLVKFEAAQSTVKCQEVFDQLFADPDWEALYELAGMEAGSYEGVEAFASFMDAKVGDSELTYLETSAGLSGDKKYVRRLFSL